MENLVETEAAQVVFLRSERSRSVLSMSQYLLYGGSRNNSCIEVLNQVNLMQDARHRTLLLLHEPLSTRGRLGTGGIFPKRAGTILLVYGGIGIGASIRVLAKDFKAWLML